MLAVTGGGAYSWVGTVGGILGVIGLVGAAVAVLRSSIATNTIKLLQANNAALHDQNGQQAQTIETQNAKIKHLEEKTADQDEKIRWLQERVDAKAVLGEINSKVDQMLEAMGGDRK